MATVVAASPLATSVGAGGFRLLDELVRDPSARGFHGLHGAGAVLTAAAAHVARRARAQGRAILEAGRFAASCPWRELALRAGSTTADPLAAAQEILAAASGGVILVVEGASSAWGRAVAEEIACLVGSGSGSGASDGGCARGALVLVCSEGAPKPWARGIELGGAMDADEMRAWWEAVAQDAERRVGPRLAQLDALEGWWSVAMATPPGQAPAAPELGGAARSLLARVALSRRPWRAAQLGRLGTAEAREELIGHAVLRLDERGWIVPAGAGAGAAVAERAGDATTAAREDVLAVAEALDGIPSDPWAWARASELFAAAGLADRAEAAAVRAIAGVGDVTARADFCQRWRRSIDELHALHAPPAPHALPSEPARARLLRSAEIALRAGDVEGALEFARAAVARGGESCEALITLGRATTARGDLTTAGILLQKALGCAPDAAPRARAAVELAEVRYKAGDPDGARRLAEEALAGAADLDTRLGARNVIGKLYLASSAWAEAEEHFAADAWDAASGGDPVAELRARLNRAIALLSMGRLDEARSILLGVLEDGEGQRELRATGLALSNLSVIALLKHEYLDALRLAERALDVFRVMGEKATLAHLITNLAELRLQMGLVAEAEQALAFGRKVCGPEVPGSRMPHLALVAAQIHLARGRTLEATAEVNSAIASASGSSNGAKLGECCGVAARIALEDGNLPRAEQMIARARAEASSARARAEVAVLEAMLGRARGAAFADAAGRALDLAREADDSERLREGHVLLHGAALDAGDARAARHHLEAALGLRDRVAVALPEEMRKRFLARRDLEDLVRIEALSRRDAEAAGRACELCGDGACAGCARPIPSSEPSRRAPALPAVKRLVGRDPAMRGLLARVQRVGASDATVLVQGESGTGKELVAEALHEASARHRGPLIKVNCAALVETLLLSELFGHERGSFTGAAARRRGRFELAEGGTLFLDEIGDISPRTQVALLRVLQDKTFERVGGVTPLRANVRIVCATHRDLRAMVGRGEFREDLYYRLRQVVLEVPALRQRVGDLPEIAASILARIAGEWGAPLKRLSARALGALGQHAWPGNVRELENALRAAALFTEGEVIDVEHFASNVEGLAWLAEADEPLPSGRGSGPGRPSGRGSARGSSRSSEIPSEPGSDPSGSWGDLDFGAESVGARPAPSLDDGAEPGAASGRGVTPVEVAYAHVRAGTSLGDMKREIERACIARALEESRGNITRAAVLLGMKRPRLSQLVKQYGFGGVSED